MNGGSAKARTRRSRATQSKAVQAKPLDAAADAGAETPRVQSLVNGGLARDATPAQTAKRQLDATSQSDPLPAKRVRLTRTGAGRPRVEKAEQADKTTRHPKPKPPNRRDTFFPEPKAEGQEQVSPATQLQKRQIDGGGDNERELKRVRLTQKNLAQFNKMARKKASTPPECTDGSSTTKTTSTTSSGFAIQARKNGMLDPLHSKPPTNIEDIRERHARSRVTASPPESAYEGYANNVGKAPNEATMVFEVGAQLLKRYDDKGYNRVFNQAFTGFPKDVGFNDSLSAPQPDFVEGLEMEEYLPFLVDECVSGAILYKDNPTSLTLPHLAGEWKGSGKDMEKARLQSRYDGAALVYARNQALSYLDKPDPSGHAEVTTFTTDGTNLNFYAHYALEEGNRLEYHQYQYASTNVKDTYQGHKDGYKGIRNEQDYAKNQSYALKDQLKKHWKQRRSGVQPIAGGAGFDDIPEEPPLSAKPTQHKRTSRKAPLVRADDEFGYEIIDKPPTPPQSSEERRRSTRLSNARQLSSDDSANTTAKKPKYSSRGKATPADHQT